MPTAEDMDNISGADNGPGDPVPEPKGRQDFNFKLDTSALSREIASGVRSGFQEMLAANRPQQIDPDEQALEISEEDDQATVVQKTVHNSLIPLRRDMKQFRSFGLDKLGHLTSKQELLTLPYYNEYKAEIDVEVAKLPAEYRADANTLRAVYNNVVAGHVDEIANKRAEERARATQLENEPAAPGRTNTRVQGKTGGNNIPTPEELGFNDDQISEIESRGGQDRFAMLVSGGRYKNWGEYAAGHARMTAAPRTPRGRTIQFKRLSDKKPASA